MSRTNPSNARRIDAVVIGGGQAGLAMSRCLSERSIDHVVLERGEVAHSWRTERWDSLRLLTPNWLSRLPHWTYRGPDRDGYMTSAEVVGFLDAYRRSFAAPVQTSTTVQRITPGEDGHLVETDEGPWLARAVVIATGACSTPHRPGLADSLDSRIHQLSPIEYRSPSQIADGGVLVVGASASGIQIADELSRAGRNVTLAAGEHVRLPRTYRGMDIHWWMDLVGLLDERYDEVEDLTKARRLPSLQLIGSPGRHTLGLNEVAASGVTVVGRLAAIQDHRALCSGSLANICKLADLKQRRLLDRLDEFAAQTGLEAELGPIDRPDATDVSRAGLEVDLRSIETVVWATGFRPDYPWMDPGLLDAKGQLVHDGGVLPAPGMYALGLPFMRRRKSSFLDGVGPDAIELSDQLVAHLDRIAAGHAA